MGADAETDDYGFSAFSALIQVNPISSELTTILALTNPASSISTGLKDTMANGTRCLSKQTGSVTSMGLIPE